jgi:hypothetical protein
MDAKLPADFDAQYTPACQPAVSHALGRLRESFADPLFVRRGRALAPTPLAPNNKISGGRLLSSRTPPSGPIAPPSFYDAAR